MIMVQSFCNFTSLEEMCKISIKIELVNTCMGILILLAVFFRQDQSDCVLENINNLPLIPYAAAENLLMELLSAHG